VAATLASSVPHISVETVLDRIVLGADLQREDFDKWTILRPRFTLRDEKMHMNRAAAQQFLRDAWKAKWLDLFALAAYQSTISCAFDRTLIVQYFDLLLPELFLSCRYDILTLRLLGTLTPEQRNAAMGTTGLAVADMNNAQASILESILYDKAGPLKPTLDPDHGSYYGSLQEEPTEVFSQGLPSSTVFHLKVQSKQVPVGFLGDSSVPIALRTDELVSSEVNKLAPVQGQSWRGYATYGVAVEQTIIAKIDFGNVCREESLFSLACDPLQQKLSYDALPAGVKADAEIQLVSFRSNVKRLGEARKQSKPPPQ